MRNRSTTKNKRNSANFYLQSNQFKNIFSYELENFKYYHFGIFDLKKSNYVSKETSAPYFRTMRLFCFFYIKRSGDKIKRTLINSFITQIIQSTRNMMSINSELIMSPTLNDNFQVHRKFNSKYKNFTHAY